MVQGETFRELRKIVVLSRKSGYGRKDENKSLANEM